MQFIVSASFVACLVGLANGYPFADSDGVAQEVFSAAESDHSYIAPKKSDARSPCPALNTLANHGYLNRNGRDLTAAALTDSFLHGFGMHASTVEVAVDNAMALCFYLTGDACDTLPSLTMLATPHMVEHDHSLSRQDYRVAHSAAAVDSNNFNATVFDAVLAPLGAARHMDYAGARRMRMAAESYAWRHDRPGWFLGNPKTQAVETAFIFTVMDDPARAGDPAVRMDWFRYWFVNESFPTPLGWSKPSPPRDNDFVMSVVARIDDADVTHTPSVMPPATLTATNINLGTTSYTDEILPAPTNAPYVPPDADDLGYKLGYELRKRDADATGPLFPNHYADSLSFEDWSHVAAAREAYVEMRMRSEDNKRH